VIPLSKPSIFAFSLFYAVGHWNSYFNAILYLNDAEMWPIQVWLRQVVILSSGGYRETASSFETVVLPGKAIQMAVIVVATVPIVLVYPFIQKYFIKGVFLGSVKG
jgi:putative aldouronate transport system permease protein